MAISKVTLNGTTLMDATNNTANKDNTLTGYTGTKNDGTTFTGEYSTPSIEANKTYTVNSSGTLTVNPSTNYDAMEKVTLTVGSGTQGTPTATKGTVSNHSVSITPSVTNTTGYITGATKTGTAVSVNASELVSGTKSITNNGTGIDVTNYASVDVNVQGGGGGSSWTLLASQDYTVSTTSTSSGTVGTMSVGSSAFTSSSIIYVKVRDKAGGRSSHFTGSDSFFINPNPNNVSTSTITSAARSIIRCSGQGVSGLTYAVYTSGSTTGYGVYGYSINSSGDIVIQRRYNSSYSLTINGTYNVEVYALDYAPNQGNPFAYTYSS